MKNKLYILWTNDNPNTAHLMVFMYAINSILRGWWDEVTIIIWGPSARLVAENKGIQDKIQMAKDQGVHVSACIACATEYGVVDKLRSLDLEVIPWGEPLTEIIKSNQHIITI